MYIEWRRRLHPAMPPPRPTLLRLGRQLQRDEYVFAITTSSSPYDSIPSDRISHFAAAEQTPRTESFLYQRKGEGDLCEESGEGANSTES